MLDTAYTLLFTKTKGVTKNKEFMDTQLKWFGLYRNYKGKAVLPNNSFTNT